MVFRKVIPAIGIMLILIGRPDWLFAQCARWQKLDVGVGNAQINGVAMSPSGRHIVLVGPGLLHSSDGGVTWDSTNNCCGPGRIMDFGDESHLFGVGSNPGSGYAAVYQSIDYGMSWFVNELPQHFIFFSEVDFVDSVNGWATGDKDFIVTTKDGWQTWTAQSYGIPGYRGGGVSFIDSLHGWVGGGLQGTDTAVVATTDGGNTWNHYSAGIPFFSGGHIDFVDSLHGWLRAAGKGVYHSTDGGRIWAEQGTFSYFGGSVGRVQAVDSLHAWVFGDYFAPYIWKTTDGGQNWELEYNGAGGTLLDAVMVDRWHGVAVGDYGTVLIYSPQATLGDLNGDGEITVTDVVLELNKVFLNQSFVCPDQAADLNCDATFSPSDVVLLLNRVFLGTPLPCTN